MKSLTNQKLLLTSITLGVYFSILFVNAYGIKIETTLFGVIQQILTIPFLVILCFVCVISIRRVMKEGLFSNVYLLFALVFSSVTAIIVLGSFIFAPS